MGWSYTIWIATLEKKTTSADDHPEVVKELRETLDSFKKGVKE